ncbi:MAG: ATP synthase F1 subunit epsilon [Bacteroidota bacterium]|nr:ATP synthase F1 subunit epsilon [Candidatus Kapabacteria bacterium]MDW8221099.1 ATP synthase F1 subunit epsilon [Bacteroidota bacterium]
MITGKPFNLEIVTPSGVVFEGMVESVSLPAVDKPFQVLANHAPLVATLGIGAIIFQDSTQKVSIYATSGGFVQVLHNKVSCVVETAEDASSIDVIRAQESKRRAEERLAKRSECDVVRAEASLARALNRLKVAGMQR